MNVSAPLVQIKSTYDFKTNVEIVLTGFSLKCKLKSHRKNFDFYLFKTTTIITSAAAIVATNAPVTTTTPTTTCEYS